MTCPDGNTCGEGMDPFTMMTRACCMDPGFPFPFCIDMGGGGFPDGGFPGFP
jgi:hypothetical protein